MGEDRLLPVGTKVFDIRFGWGEVTELEESDYPLFCYFKGGGVMSYTKEGLSVADHKSPILSLTEYTLEKGGFTSVTEFDFDASKVGDWGYFWDNEEVEFCLFARIESIGERHKHPYKTKRGGTYRHFSKEIPEHIKKLQNEKD